LSPYVSSRPNDYSAGVDTLSASVAFGDVRQ